jgi:hypothetical protein
MRQKLAIAALLCLSIGSVLQATSLPKLDLKALVEKSDAILQGKVEAIEVRVDEKLRLPFTWVRVRVDDPMKGGRQQTVFIRHVGGKASGSPYTLAVAGTPRFLMGDNVIVFLRDVHDGSGAYQVVGMNQGKYQVINEVAVAHISGVELVDTKTGQVFPTGYVESAPVDAFKNKIRELVK